MRPYYHVNRRGFGRGMFEVPQGKRPPVYRPNRVSAGMSFTMSRSRQSLLYALYSGGQVGVMTEREKAVLRLIVFGSTDRMSGLKGFFTDKQDACPCCGSLRGRLHLTQDGRARLATLRKRRKDRNA